MDRVPESHSSRTFDPDCGGFFREKLFGTTGAAVCTLESLYLPRILSSEGGDERAGVVRPLLETS